MFPQYIVHRNFGHEENPVSVKNYQKKKIKFLFYYFFFY